MASSIFEASRSDAMLDRSTAFSLTPGNNDEPVAEFQNKKSVRSCAGTTAAASANVLPPFGVLIVEDERLIRWSLEAECKRRGFRVWVAADGGHGVEIYQKFSEEIDIILSDVQMPVLDGPRMLEVLRQINPAVRLCFMTGDSRVRRSNDLLRRGAIKVFSKPFPSLAEISGELWQIAGSPNEPVTDIEVATSDATNQCSVVVEVSLEPLDVRDFLYSLLKPVRRAIDWFGGRVGKDRPTKPIDERTRPRT